ncbi:proteasome subunit beta type-6 [Caerostris extrusa]|uniref:Proteasome subunit beta n=1 Tax=Caerostris extrusa TaxID=172846 RepID=A0AAV4SE88_CAEEX|nr:proteasome subunit beta type-6 [Caerostris extrusa]
MNSVLNMCDDTALDFMNTEESTGTTIMAVEFDGGVVLGADSRTTMGAYVSNRVTDKLTKLTDQIYVCRSGSAADTKAIASIVSYRLDMLSMELGEPVSVKTAANDVRQIIYNYRESLSASMIVAGWDRKLGGQPNKDASCMGSYRPIALTCMTCKLMKRIILRRITFHLMNRNMLPQEQYGFRKGHSTIEQILYFVQRARDAHNMKPSRHTMAVFLDLTKAFDKAWKK